MLTQDELNTPYMRSNVPSARIYMHIWDVFSKDNRSTAERKYLNLSPSIKSYVLAQVGHLNKELEWSSIDKEIDSFLKDYPYSPKNVLSLGCGVGNDLKCMKKYESELLVGVDVGRPALELAKQNLPNGDFIRASSTYLPFRDSLFDTIVTGHFFEPMTDVGSKLTFEEIRRCSEKDCLWFFSAEEIRTFEDYHMQKFGKDDWNIIYRHLYTSEIPPVPSHPHGFGGAEFLVLTPLNNGNGGDMENI